jgi:hypothetical protein
MTDIEAKALALVNEVEREEGEKELTRRIMRGLIMDEALCRAIEQHEAFKQEVSDAVEAYLNPNNRIYSHSLNRFIIPKPKPDPLVDILLDMELSSDQEQGQHDAKYLRAKLEACGLEIREKGQ